MANIPDMPVDLHIHSTASDGTLTPEEIVADAAARGVSIIAISDHDTVAGVAPALVAARELSPASSVPAVIPAVELSTQQGAHEAHILGYFIDLTDARLLAQLGIVQEARRERAGEMVRRLQSLGVRITLDDVAAGANDAQQPDSIGRPHIAAALVALGACRNAQEAFAMYLKRDRPAFVPRYKMAVSEAIETIRAAGGIPVLGHPGLMGNEGVVRHIIGLGVEGLEAYHVDHSGADTRRFIAMAEVSGLLITGGSDSHGPGGPKPVVIGQVDVPDECGERLIARARETGRLHDWVREV